LHFGNPSASVASVSSCELASALGFLFANLTAENPEMEGILFAVFVLCGYDSVGLLRWPKESSPLANNFGGAEDSTVCVPPSAYFAYSAVSVAALPRCDLRVSAVFLGLGMGGGVRRAASLR
jgi:hypothetical protein